MEARAANKYNAETYLYWKKQIDNAESGMSNFHKKGDKIFKRYRDEDRQATGNNYNILYSNTETLQPVVYSQKPIPDVRANDSKKVANRKAAEMIEKALHHFTTCKDFEEPARLAVTDFLLAGMGVMRPKYKPVFLEEDEVVTIDMVQPEDEVKEKDGILYRKSISVIDEEITFEYIYWKDIIYPYANTWSGVDWIGFRSYLTKAEAIDQFGSKKAELLKYEPVTYDAYTDLDTMKAENEGEAKVKVYEIWDKTFKQQIFYSETITNSVLEINDDPLNLEGFYPIPKPIFSIMTSGSVLPVPFFTMYESQAVELDEINNRISHMVSNLRRRGVYDSSMNELVQLSDLGDNQFLPIKNYTDFAGKGGLTGVMQTEDISSYVNALNVLYQKRQQLLEDIYQIIGIADIRRGQTDPRETLGAQQMKGRYGTIRISIYQRKVAEFMRDLLKIAGEIIINHFEPETLSAITGIPLETVTEKGEQSELVEVITVGTKDLLNNLRSKSPSDILVNIQTDSTIVEDVDAEKSDLVDITTALSQFVQIAPQMQQVMGLDATASLFLSMVQKFKLGRDIQQEVEDYIAELKKKQKEAEGQPPKPTPEEIVAQAQVAQVEVNKLKVQSEYQIKVGELQIKQQTNEIKAAEIDAYQAIEKDKLDIKSLESMIKIDAFEAEKANASDNAIVGA